MYHRHFPETDPNVKRRGFGLLVASLFSAVCAIFIATVTIPGAAPSGAHAATQPYPMPAGTPTCVPVWETVSSPRPGAFSGLYGIDVLSATDIWAVGYYKTAFNSPLQTLTMRWDGSQWNLVPSPNVGSNTNRLWAVAAITPNDVWAVGQYSSGSQGTALTMHWDGSQWDVVSNPGVSGSYLHAVTALSSDDVWAVGDYNSQPFTLHWNGANWTEIPSPGPPSRFNRLLGAVAISSNDVWVVGTSQLDYGYPARTLTMHWNGTEWSVIPSPNAVAGENGLQGVSAISSNDVWAIGDYQRDPYFAPLILRWNGSEWSMVPGPDVGTQSYIRFYGIEALSPNNVWAVGHRIIRWNGSSWTIAASSQGEYDPLFGVEALSENLIWAVGEENITSQGGRTLTKRYTGQCASGTPSPSPTSGPTNTGTVTPTRTATRPPTETQTLTPVSSVTLTPTSIPTNTVPRPSVTSTLQPTPSSTPCAISFTDVPTSHTFYASIRCLACRGIISGYADGTFKPDNLVTRGQLAKIVSNAAGFTEDPGPQVFQDVPVGHTFYEWINRLTNRGYMSGYNCGSPGEPCIDNRPYFRPYANATRAQTSKIVANAAQYNDPPTGQTFEDVPPSHPFYVEIQRLASRGIMGGYECGGPGEPCRSGNRPYFRPYNNVTRGQSAKIVANTFYPNCHTP